LSSTAKRAVGIVRASRIKGRDKKNDGEALHSPEVQRERIEQLCTEKRWKLVEVFDEGIEGGRKRDASGAKPLAEGLKLRPAVEASEAGRADVLVTA
jgi:DNA invertase Pin-like site-specific DNA recombinase